MIIFGSSSSIIGIIPISFSKCDYCGQEGKHVMIVFGNYAHIFGLPFFPIGRDVYSECTHCKRTIKRKEFCQEFNQQYLANTKRIQRPSWHWLGLWLVGFLVVLVFFIGFIT